MSVSPFYFVALAALLLLSAFFSGSEAALFSLRRAQVRALSERPGGGALGRLLEEPRRILVSILLGNLLVNIFTTSTATALLVGLLGERGGGYAFLLMALLIIVFGEIFPKTIALRWAERIAVLAAYPLRVFHAAVLPARLLLSAFSEAVIARVRRGLGAPARSYTSEELVTALSIARREGAVGELEYQMLANALSFRDKVVKEIMTPNVQVVSASVQTGRVELVRAFAGSGFSRIPVYDRSPDDIIGVLHIKDLIADDAASSETDLRARLRAPYFVPETTAINAVYHELQTRQLHIAIVLDEYSSFAGIVTVEDILEELVGEIRDARDSKAPSYMSLDERRMVVSGTMEIDEFNEVFGADIEDDDHETIAGYVMGATGRIPREGETIVIEGLRFHIVSAQLHRIRKMRVERA
ncbi:MAG: hemolysin family protein [Candidatus Krumholzibacteria bacterium]|nr:hemolysin family protein [Candidatus Krumholzibacteria bacterium]